MQQNMRLSFQRYNTLINQSLQWMVLGYQMIAVVLFLIGLYFANGWLSQPFLGALYEHTLVFNGTGPATASPAWALFHQVVVGDQLVAIDGTPVKSAEEISAVLKGRLLSEDAKLTIRSANGELRELTIVLHSFPSSSRTVYFVIPIVLSVIFLVASLWIFGLRRTEPAGRAFSLFTSSLAIITGTYFDLVTTHHFTIVWTAAAAICAGALINLAVTFPLELRIIINRPYLRWTGIVIGLVLFAFTYGTLFNFDEPTAYISRWKYIFGFLALSDVFYYVSGFCYTITVHKESRGEVTFKCGSVLSYER